MIKLTFWLLCCGHVKVIYVPLTELHNKYRPDCDGCKSPRQMYSRWDIEYLTTLN